MVTRLDEREKSYACSKILCLGFLLVSVYLNKTQFYCLLLSVAVLLISTVEFRFKPKVVYHMINHTIAILKQVHLKEFMSSIRYRLLLS